jgi:hypothetical protein
MDQFPDAKDCPDSRFERDWIARPIGAFETYFETEDVFPRPFPFSVMKILCRKSLLLFMACFKRAGKKAVGPDEALCNVMLEVKRALGGFRLFLVVVVPSRR